MTLRDAAGNPTTAVEDVTVNYSVSGTATEGGDFVTLDGYITILAGDDTATITVEVLQDSFIEGVENVIITLDSVESPDLDPLAFAPGLDRVFVGALGSPQISFQQLSLIHI